MGLSSVISSSIFSIFPLLCYLIPVLYNNSSKEIDHSFDICENISVVHI